MRPHLIFESARSLWEDFRRYDRNFRRITRRAPGRFATRDWQGARADLAERLDLWEKSVARSGVRMERLLGEAARERGAWVHIKRAYGARVDGFPDAELARTFFTSVTRRLLGTVGVDPEVEFVLDLEPGDRPGGLAPTRVHLDWGSRSRLLLEVLLEARLPAPLADPEGDAARGARELERLARRHYRNAATLHRLQMLECVFYQGERAWLVGRAEGEGWVAPLALELRHDREGIALEALHMSEAAMSIVFGFTRSSFFVDAEPVRGLVQFLGELLPEKPIDELYSVLGRIRQGKTERYRALARTVRQSREHFVRAPGQRGLVMCVFTLPSWHLVFKVIRDRFGPGKQVTRSQVLERYRLVSRHDRLGRLIDVQAFRHVTLPRRAFAGPMLRELLESAARSVRVEGENVVFEHLYMERKVRPLDLFLAEASWVRAQEAVIDWGRAIRELAATNIFPGDMLLKNFGVTRHGRVVFYDFDEVCLLEQCRFRRLPPMEDDLLALSPEPWGEAGENDVFPEQFAHFLGLRPRLRSVFLEHHAELLDPAWWRGMQAEVGARGAG